MSTPKTQTNKTKQYSALPLVQQVQNVALYMNTKLHKQAREFKSSFDATPENIASLDLVDAYNNADP